MGEHKAVKTRLKTLSLTLQPQLKRLPRYPSKKLPAHIHITFFVNRENFDVPALCLLTHQILSAMRLTTIIQDTNNRCIAGVSISHKIVKNPIDEGCVIDFKD